MCLLWEAKLAGRPVGLYWISTTTKFNKISTKYRTQHFIAQNIDQQNFFKMSIIATLHISRPKHACSMLILARLFNILFLIFNFFSFNTLSSFEIYVSYNHCERFFDKYRPFKCNIDHKFKNIDQWSIISTQWSLWLNIFKPAAFGNGDISLFAFEVVRGLDSLVCWWVSHIFQLYLPEHFLLAWVVKNHVHNG